MIKLFKAENRSIIENEHLRVNSMQNDNDKHSFSYIDDVAINEYGKYKRSILSDGYIILLPLLNDIRLDLEGFKWKIEVNQVFIYYLEKGKTISIEGGNGFDFSYFITVFIPKEKFAINNVLLPIELKKDNILKKIIRTDFLNVYIGKYNLSKTDVLPFKKADRKWIVLSITGVFEVHERLIESRDVIEINGQQFVNFESLSTESLLFVLEL